MIVSNILRQYQNLKSDYTDLMSSARKKLERKLNERKIEFHKIESRIKDRKTIEAKIIRKNFKYASVKEITDIVGLRVIVLYEDEIQEVAQVVEKIFKIDLENSVDRLDFNDHEKFGYRSLHFVASIKRNDLKFEIQIRTILQHAWAELHHKLGYKIDLEIPRENLREFSRLSGLLEIGDRSFIHLRDELFDYSKTIKRRIDHSLNIDINKDSIRTFINNDPIVKGIDRQLVKRMSGKLISNNYFEDELKIAQYLGLSTLRQLRSLIWRNRKKIIESSARTYTHLNEKEIPKGIGIAFLGYLFADKKGEVHEILELLNKIELFPRDERKALAVTLHNKINYK